uniref:Uncharacterized protein LOC100180322 n=1 Tax=Phallusia mammillata TaxID=59560 RepID=A0A6F9DGI7_9ASCI|nr:uncharacterized protein LOC100180322 [Phallusia mammillata]
MDNSESIDEGIPELFMQFLSNQLESQYASNHKARYGEELIREFFKMENMNLDRNEEEVVKPANVHKNTVAIIGDPGMGKTKMVQTLVNQIRHKKVWINTKIIFFLRAEEIDFSLKQEMKDFLLSGLTIRCTSEELSPQDFKNMEEGGGCMVVVDGIDAARTDAFKRDDQLNLYLEKEVTTADVHIKNLLLGRTFHGSKKVLTCRKHDFFEIAPVFRPAYIVTCNGLNLRQGYREICEAECESPHQVKLMMKFLDKHPDIEKVCHVPLVSVTVVHFLKQNIEILARTDALLSLRESW